MFERIRLRLTAAYVGILALILVLFGGVTVIVFRDHAFARQDEDLIHEAESKRESLLAGREEDFVPTPGQPYAAWGDVSPEGQIDPTSGSAETPDIFSLEQAQTAVREGEDTVATIEGPHGPLRVASLPVIREGTVVAVVQTGQLRQDVQGNVSQLILVLATTGLGALVLAAGGGLLMSSRALGPVRESFQRQRSFIADASHELKTPLALIRVDAEVLSRTDLDSDQREQVENLLEETDRMNAVLSDLLLLARLDGGKLSVDDVPFDLVRAIVGTAERFAARAAAEGITLECLGEVNTTTTPNGIDLRGELRARGDRERTAQILAALLDNAVQFTPPGGTIGITARERDSQTEVTVTDSGPGITPEFLPHVFERFYRGESARGSDGGATGLGLAIARDLARAQGGDLSVENVPTAGARFTLHLRADS